MKGTARLPSSPVLTKRKSGARVDRHDGSSTRAHLLLPDSIRLTKWPYDQSIALLYATDYNTDFSETDVNKAIDVARSMGFRRVRTGALRSRSATVVAHLEFHVIDELELLGVDPRRVAPTGARHRTRRLAARHLTDAATVDLAAFGPLWSHDEASLLRAQSATIVSRSRRVAANGERVCAYAISGLSNGSGYIQRLAVSPPRQRCGHARLLIVDALRWMARTGATRALVNTSVTNEPALALYTSLGFTRLGEYLVVAERELDT